MKKSLLFLSLLIIICSCSQLENSEFTIIQNHKTDQLNTFFTQLFQDEKLNGNVLIAEKGEIIYEKAFGKADEAENHPLNTETRFELASLSKQFTAMGIVQLKKEGLLNYDDLLSKHIPELAHYEGITIKNLLIHTSGLPDYIEMAETKWDHSQIATNQDMIELFKQYQPALIFQPNEKYEYSNTGYMLLGSIIERVSGKSFEEYLKEKIFEPAKMTNTFIYRRRFAPMAIKNYANGYIFSDSLDRKIIPDSSASNHYVVYLDGIFGDGMVNSNLRDLLRWDRILYSDELIDEVDRTEIFSSYFTLDSTSTDYGFGWKIDSSKIYGKIAKHSGGWAGYVNYIERHLDHDKTIIILQNNRTQNTTIPIKNTRRILYDLPVELPITLNETVLGKYAGTYVNNQGNEKQITLEDGQLRYYLESDFSLELVPVSNVKFILEGFRPKVTYTFKLNENDQVIDCRVQQIEQGIDRTLVKKNEEK